MKIENVRKFLLELFVTIGLAIVAMVIALLVGCRSPRAVQSTVVADTTSVKVVHHIEQVRDTVYVELPQIIERNVTRDTVSHLENEYAKSDAIVDGEFLWHTLEMKPQEKAVEIIKEIEYRDTTIYKEIIKEAERIVEVERSETWLGKTQKITFWTMLTALALYILWRRLKSKISIL